MNRLPDNRRVIHGRTFDRAWYAADYDPIERYRTPLYYIEMIMGAGIIISCAALIICNLVIWWGD